MPKLGMDVGFQGESGSAARQSRWESRDNQDENAPLLG
jgi:hypothetical protein